MVKKKTEKEYQGTEKGCKYIRGNKKGYHKLSMTEE